MEVSPNRHRISNYFALPVMKQAARVAAYAQEDSLWTNTVPMENNNYIFGIEVEVENVPNPVVYSKHLPYWKTVPDNSLRNNGVEFVTVPLKATQIEHAVCQLANSLPDNRVFSERTSVHVHMNVRDLTIDNITALLTLYTLVENLLFKWVGHNRDKSVFCTKLIDTDYVTMYTQFQREPQVIRNWNKYTAFNMLPIMEKGTVEFRHMYGTIDKTIILQWVNLLSCLKTAAKTYHINQLLPMIYELNSTSEYEMFLHKIFGNHIHQLLWDDTPELMAEAVCYLKLATIPLNVVAPPVAEPRLIPDIRRHTYGENREIRDHRDVDELLVEYDTATQNRILQIMGGQPLLRGDNAMEPEAIRPPTLANPIGAV